MALDKIYIDNRIFNVNGRGEEMLRRTLEVAFAQAGTSGAVGWSHSTKSGFVLYASECEGINLFPAPLSSDEVAPMVVAYLRSNKAKEVELKGADVNADHDGHNTVGWRAFCEGWGSIAVKPAYMWHGK